MSNKNKFEFGPVETPATPKPRERTVGPMGAAVRDAAESMKENTLTTRRREQVCSSGRMAGSTRAAG